ncbi:MAG: Plug domain-containing protein [Bacteroidales bacterium]|nr:Plug domain-containing protein [Bacteroidales bacterium]
MKAIKTLTAALLWAAAIPVSGHRSDTDGPVFTCDTIRTSVITAEKGITVSRRDTVELDGNQRIEDAMLKIPGLSVNDNGGFSALKTVSLRGLGSSQTDIYIDGIKVGNLMSGQTDIGMLGMWNLGAAIVDYAQNRIDFHTSIPEFRQKGDNHRKITGSLLSKGGSFGTFIPAISLSIKCSDNITASINSEGLLSESHRENSDIRQIKGGIDLSGRSAGGNWKAKAFANASNRQSPGSITYPYLLNKRTLIRSYNQVSTKNSAACIL